MPCLGCCLPFPAPVWQYAHGGDEARIDCLTGTIHTETETSEPGQLCFEITGVNDRTPQLVNNTGLAVFAGGTVTITTVQLGTSHHHHHTPRYTRHHTATVQLGTSHHQHHIPRYTRHHTATVQLSTSHVTTVAYHHRTARYVTLYFPYSSVYRFVISPLQSRSSPPPMIVKSVPHPFSIMKMDTG